MAKDIKKPRKTKPTPTPEQLLKEDELRLINYMIERERENERERIKRIKEKLHTYIAYLGHNIAVFVAPSKDMVLDYLYEKGYVKGYGRMDLGEQVWELPLGGFAEDKVSLITYGNRDIERILQEEKEALMNMGAGI